VLYGLLLSISIKQDLVPRGAIDNYLVSRAVLIIMFHLFLFLCARYLVSPQQWGADAGMAPPQSVQCTLLEEPSPLGLRLRKSPSLLDLIQMRLSQGNSSTASCFTSNRDFESGKKKDLKSTAISGTTDKLKASNFPASLLKIGSWEVTTTSPFVGFLLFNILSLTKFCNYLKT